MRILEVGEWGEHMLMWCEYGVRSRDSDPHPSLRDTNQSPFPPLCDEDNTVTMGFWNKEANSYIESAFHNVR
jgi:hypothetical protein